MPDARANDDDRSAERALIDRACYGCSESFGQLVLRHQDRLYNFLLRRCRDPHTAEEVAQAAFVRAWQHMAKFDTRWRFSTWLYTIAMRLASDDRRRQSLLNRIDEAGQLSDVTAADPVETISRGEEFSALWAIADAELDADERTALWLRYGDDASTEQIAQVLQRSNVAVRVLLHRARKRLAQAWLEREDKNRQRQTALRASTENTMQGAER